MRKFAVLMFFGVLLACNNDSSGYKKPENALDAGREFIENSLKGRFETARQYMLQTDENKYWLDKVSHDYNQYSEQDKNGYSNASINIAEVDDQVPDSVLIINFSNSYVKRPQKLKVVKYQGEWKVDLNYTFERK